MTDIVERLRDKWKHSEEDCYKAADEIERLRSLLSELLSVMPAFPAKETKQIVGFEDRYNTALEKLRQEVWRKA